MEGRVPVSHSTQKGAADRMSSGQSTGTVPESAQRERERGREREKESSQSAPPGEQEIDNPKDSPQTPKIGSNRWSPLAESTSQTPIPEGYGAVRLRQQKGPPLVSLRPPEMKQDDLMEILEENHGTKRSLSPEGQTSAPSKHVRTDEDECLMSELVHENGPASCVEVLIASFLQKKMQKELHHSNNPFTLQEQGDLSKTTEWTTLRDEKQAIKVIPPQ